jgi:hypothetical protein
MKILYMRLYCILTYAIKRLVTQRSKFECYVSMLNVFLYLLPQPTNAIDKMQFVANIKLLLVTVPGCHTRGV